MSLQAPDPVPARVAGPIPRRYVALGLVVVVVALLAALVVVRNDKTTTNTPAVETFTVAPPSVMQPLTHIPKAIVDATTDQSDDALAPLTATHSTSVWQASSPHVAARPVVFFYDAEFAPYAAAERWPLIVALSRFGHFSNVGLMQSSNSMVFADTQSFTFSNSTYSSVWINFQGVERYSALDPTGGTYTALQKTSPTQQAAVAIYDAGGATFPLLDIANRFTLTGANFSPAVLAGQNQAQIVADLAIPTSPVTQAIVGSANEITAAICAVTGERPVTVCQTRGVTDADARLGLTPTGAKS